MSSTTRTDETATANQSTTHALPAVSESTDTTAATTACTETEHRLWEALHANPNSTAADLSTDAGIGRSTAAKILARWANKGSVSRTPGITEGGRRAADLWSITDPEAPSVTSKAVETEHADTENATTAPSTDTDETMADGDSPDEVTADAAVPTADDKDTSEDGQQKMRRLPSGGLRGLVEDWLRDHPGEEFSPNAIGKALGRSSGAVANALDKLVAAGYAAQTQDKPKRFTAVKTTPDPATPNN
jgi:DNA-binding MarR family transcriptional regulator